MTMVGFSAVEVSGGSTRATRMQDSRKSRLAAVAAAVLTTLLVGGCAQAQSDEPSQLSRTLKIRTVPKPAPDFVVKSRPPEDRLQFIPTGSPRAVPRGQPLTPEQIRAKEGELDGLRARHDRIAGRKSAPPAPRSVADGGAKKKVPPKPLRCVLTCPDPATTPVKPGQPPLQPVSGL